MMVDEEEIEMKGVMEEEDLWMDLQEDHRGGRLMDGFVGG